MDDRHQPVLLKETLDLLNIKPEGRYVDGTLGLGGHTEAILKRLGSKGQVLGLDVDPQALSLTENRLQPFEDQTITRQVNFRGLQGVLRELGWDLVDGLLFDLGVSSAQLESGDRGFSFQREGPLDMRLNPHNPETALSILQKIDERRLTDVFQQFGEVRNAKKLTRYLLADIAFGRITTTTQLAEFCERVLSRRGKLHPATKVFLAIRCLVNDELGALSQMLNDAPGFLNVGGRLAIISFHSLEDRLVKLRYKELSLKGDGDKKFLIVTKKPVVPTKEEMVANPRSRSAKLRVLERVQ